MNWKSTFALLVCLLASLASFAQEPSWPRQYVKPAGTVLAYPPQVDSWTDFTTLTWRQAFQFTPSGGKAVVGAATFQGTTSVDADNHMVFIYNLKILNIFFPSQSPDNSQRYDALIRTFLPQTVDISLQRLVAYTSKPATIPTVPLNNEPPVIFVSNSPAILLNVDGEPVFTSVPDTKLKTIVNSPWPLFQDESTNMYYLLVSNIWLTTSNLQYGPWTRTTSLPKTFAKLPNTGKFVDVRAAYPPPIIANAIVPKVFFATQPAEVILFDGSPIYQPITGTQLAYASNSMSPVFVYNPTMTYYYLAAGRWFSATTLNGPWTFASFSLPADFARIPVDSPVGSILSSVPGTPEAKDAALIAQIPTTMVINPTTAAAQVKVAYDGDPKFVPISGTTMYYASNTVDKVIQVGDVYYLCLQGVWFMSPNPNGPWTTAPSVPSAIYTIPPSSPVYNVTYVTQTTLSDGNVSSSYTAGYLGVFVMGAAVGAICASGTGYYYPPYIGYPAYGYPIYHPYPMPYGYYGAYGATPYYNTRTGAYGAAQTVATPYGTATRAAQYNPYTGTYARGASTSTAYGHQSVAQAYNPYTGTYAATHQGSSPTAQWGQSYVQNGNKSAYTQHYSTANGTVASATGSQGGKAYGTSTAYGNTYAGKNSSGDMYAGHDGNVYQNTGSGWQKYDNGSWTNVNTQQAQQQAQQDKSNYQQQHPDSQQNMDQARSNYSQSHPSSSGFNSQEFDQDRQNRMSGASQSYSRGGGGGWGNHNFGGYGGGGRSFGGGGFRR